MRALVLGAALRPGGDAFYAELLEEHELVVAADAAAEECVRLGRPPDVAIGDFDSATPGADARLAAIGVAVVRHPAEKDASDLDLAVEEARRRGASSVTISGAFDDRLDHTLAAFGSLIRAADLRARACEPDLAAWALDGRIRPSLRLHGTPGSLVSLLSPGGAQGVVLTGFRYAVRGGTLGPLESLGLSNVLEARTATVSIESGELLVLAPRRRGDETVRAF